MDRFDFEAFIKERNEALASLDKDRIIAYMQKYRIEIPEDEYIFWISVHKAISGAKGINEDIKLRSVRWLVERGYKHFASDLEITK